MLDVGDRALAQIAEASGEAGGSVYEIVTQVDRENTASDDRLSGLARVRLSTRERERERERERVSKVSRRVSSSFFSKRWVRSIVF